MTEAEARRLMDRARLCQEAAERTAGAMRALWTCKAAELCATACIGAESIAEEGGRQR